VLAENEEGYRNLVKITSELRYTVLLQARVSKKFLRTFEGLIGLSDA